MMSLEELAKIRESAMKKMSTRNSDKKVRIVVGMATCGISAGARPVLNALVEEVNKRELVDVEVTQTGCIGICRLEPIFEVYQNGEKVTYVDMNAEKAKEVIVNHIVNGNIIEKYTIGAYEK